MKPIYIILYAVIVTTILTAVFTRSSAPKPGQSRLFLILATVGLMALGAVILIVSTR